MRLYPFLTHLIAAGVMACFLTVSVAADAQAPTPYPSAFAEPLPVDRGAAAVWQSLKKLQTRASLMMVVAHPDDEDGGMLTYESRGQGADGTLLTLDRKSTRLNSSH